MNIVCHCGLALALLGAYAPADASETASDAAGKTAGAPRAAALSSPALSPPALSSPALLAAAPAASAADPGPRDTRVIEDGSVRIEESRLRGQTQTVTVQSKLPGMKAYEVILPPLGKDPSQDKGAAGKRTWSILGF
jgi:hypothetical protein